jgi:hypothetical protein
VTHASRGARIALAKPFKGAGLLRALAELQTASPTRTARANPRGAATAQRASRHHPVSGIPPAKVTGVIRLPIPEINLQLGGRSLSVN